MPESSLHAILRVGPASIPIWALLVLAGYFIASIYNRFSYRNEREIRLSISDRMSSFVFIAFIAWKLTPVLADIRASISQPLFIIYATGGIGAVLAGTLTGSAYFLFSLRKLPGDGNVTRRQVVIGSVRFLGIAVLVFVLGFAISSVAAGRKGDTTRVSAPEIQLFTLAGEEVSLADYRGKTVILNFWATWCPPCRAELPLFVAFDNGRNADDAVILTVNQTASETSLEALRGFADDMGIAFPILLDPDNRVFSAYGIRGIPTTFVIGPDGGIEDRRFGVVSRSWLERNR